MDIPFGAGFFVRNPTSDPFTMVFEGTEGTVREITAPTNAPRFYAVTCPEAQPISLADRLGFPLVDGDAAYRLVNGLWLVTAL